MNDLSFFWVGVYEGVKYSNILGSLDEQRSAAAGRPRKPTLTLSSTTFTD